MKKATRANHIRVKPNVCREKYLYVCVSQQKVEGYRRVLEAITIRLPYWKQQYSI
jgi:hypothetical protein